MTCKLEREIKRVISDHDGWEFGGATGSTHYRVSHHKLGNITCSMSPKNTDNMLKALNRDISRRERQC